MRAGDVFGVVPLVSAIVETADWIAPESAEVGPEIDIRVLVESFIDISTAETTAALHALAALLPDEFLAAMARREASERTHPLPDSATRVAEWTAGEAFAFRYDDGSGQNIVLELVGPGLREAVVVTWIDHSRGGALRDAYLAESDLASLRQGIAASSKQERVPGTFVDLSPADCRALLEDAIANYDLHERFIEDTGGWPVSRPLLRFLLAKLPAGGVGLPQITAPQESDFDFYDESDRFENEDDAEDAFHTHAFLQSPQARAVLDVDDDLDHDLAHLIDKICSLLVARRYEIRVDDVELLLNTFAPLLADDGTQYDRAATVLGAFIQYGHEQLGISARKTRAVLAELDDRYDEFLESRHDPHVAEAREAAAAKARLAQLPWEDQMIAQAYGSTEAVNDPDLTPLPDEPLNLSGVPGDIHERVRAIAAITDELSDEGFDQEFRTACRRLLAAVAEGDPQIFRRRAKDETAAAAVIWIIGRVNGGLGVGGFPSAGEVSERLGITGSPSGRAQTFLRAIGADESAFHYSHTLGRPELLTAQFRAELVERRNRWRGYH